MKLKKIQKCKNLANNLKKLSTILFLFLFIFKSLDIDLKNDCQKFKLIEK